MATGSMRVLNSFFNGLYLFKVHTDCISCRHVFLEEMHC